MLGGVDLVVGGTALLVLPILLGSLLSWLTPVTGLLGDGGIVDELYAGPWPWVLAALVLIGVGLVVGGAIVSRRMLRRSGFWRPIMLTAGGFGVGLGVRLVLGVFVTPFSTLLSPLLDRAVAAFDTGPGQSVAVIASIFVALSMNTAMVAAVGMVSWWWLAHVTRPTAGDPRVPVQGVQPSADGQPTEGASAT
jgi:hypothetical protein